MKEISIMDARATTTTKIIYKISQTRRFSSVLNVPSYSAKSAIYHTLRKCTNMNWFSCHSGMFKPSILLTELDGFVVDLNSLGVDQETKFIQMSTPFSIMIRNATSVFASNVFLSTRLRSTKRNEKH